MLVNERGTFIARHHSKARLALWNDATKNQTGIE
jgi:hypothetical protein